MSLIAKSLTCWGDKIYTFISEKRFCLPPDPSETRAHYKFCMGLLDLPNGTLNPYKNIHRLLTSRHLMIRSKLT